CAASLVPDRAVVILDIGTSCAAVARHLRGREVTVVTASLAVVDELRDDRSIELVVLGGLLRPSYLSLVGSITLDVISRLSADISFIGTSGVRADGTVLDSTGTEVPIKHAIMERSERRCLVASADKFPGSGLLPVCEVGDFSDVVTTAPRGTAPFDGFADRIDVRFV
ncbi:MAG: ArsR family transcriptional regulator, partial [Actinobacteria bacterium]|nr:ArsR family transcriptional regulator [Actinomycetota bacterium]